MKTLLALSIAALAVVACNDVTAPGPALCEFWQTVPQTIPGNSAETTITFDAHTPGCSQVLAPGGVYQIEATVTFSGNLNGLRGASLYVNDTSRADAESAPLNATLNIYENMSAIVESDGSAVVRVTGSQNSGQPLATVPAYQTDHLTRLSFTRLH